MAMDSRRENLESWGVGQDNHGKTLAIHFMGHWWMEHDGTWVHLIMKLMSGISRKSLLSFELKATVCEASEYHSKAGAGLHSPI
jgi:hypothetical protein